MLNGLFILTLLAALGSGMMAGLFFAFSAFIMQALDKRGATIGITAMQSINATILNPIFFTLFFGTALVGAVSGVWALVAWSDAGSGWRLAGALLYLVGSIGITMRCNVPLNIKLDKLDAASADSAALWSDYLKRWLPWNHVRTIGCIGATGSFILGMP